jgi:hypothetical protein
VTETGTVRFCETERYDPLRDAQVVRLMAVTNIGTWHCETPMDAGSKLRAKREAFKTYVLQAMSYGQLPKEVNLG